MDNSKDTLILALYLMADEVRGMATIGGHYATSIYEKERAESMMVLATKIAALAESTYHDNPRNAEQIRAIFDEQPWHRFSPTVGVDAAVFNPKGEILLIQRRDNAHWAMPGGISEIGHTFAETAVKELWEEAGMRGRAKRLLGIFDARLWAGWFKGHLMNMVFHVECEDFTPAPGIECLDAGFFAADRLPEPMHSSHIRRVPKCFELFHSGETYFDPAESLNGHLPMHQRPDGKEQER